MPYIKSIAFSDTLWARVQVQFARWAKSTGTMRQDVKGAELPPAMNRFLSTAVLVYVENMEALTDEDLQIPPENS